MLQDLRYAWRIVRKAPALSAVVVATLAIGIGANTAVFSLIHGALLRPLPYREPARLIDVADASTKNPELSKTFGSYADFEEYSRSTELFEDVAFATWATGGVTWTGYGPPREVLAIPVSDRFFSVLGVTAARGRTFARSDVTGGCSVVLSDGFWKTALASDAAVVGRVLNLDRRSCVVLGVMRPAFEFYPRQTKLWMLLTAGDSRPKDRLVGLTFARLRTGITTAQAQAELERSHRHLSQGDWHRDFRPVASKLQDDFTVLAGRNTRATLYTLMAAVLLVLLIACLNVANLLLGRASTRSQEFAIRAALGSGSRRLVRQLLTEGFLLASIGGAAGLCLASGLLSYFVSVSPIELPVGSNISLNGAVLLFTAVLTVTTALVFSLVPAWSGSRQDLNSGIRRASPLGLHGAGRKLIQTLVTVEIALALVLIAGANLLVRSVFNMTVEPLGFDPGGVTTVSATLPAERYATVTDKLRLYDRLERSLARIQITSPPALATTMPPYSSGNYELQLEGGPRTHIQDTGQNSVNVNYFHVLRIGLLRGRLFDAHDSAGSEDVAIINDSLARKFFRGTDPLGQRIRTIGFTEGSWATIVGVVATEKHPEFLREMAWREQPAVYRPLRQEPAGYFSIAVRDPGNGGAIETVIASADSEISVGESTTLDSSIGLYLKYPRFRGAVVSFFAGIALLLATRGLHGLMAQYVAQRKREFGLRIALGATVRDIARLIASQAGTPVVAGLTAGVLLIGSMSRYVSSLLFGVEPLDAAMLALTLAVLIGAAVAAVARPLRSATTVNPGVALRDD